MTESFNEETQPSRKTIVLDLLWLSGVHGITVEEIRRLNPEYKRHGDHHGSWSGTLANLHRDGYVYRLKQKRDNNDIYILPEWAGEREVCPQGNPPKPLELLLAYWMESEFEGETRSRARKYPARFVTEISEAWSKHCKPGSNLDYRIKLERASS